MKKERVLTNPLEGQIVKVWYVARVFEDVVTGSYPGLWTGEGWRMRKPYTKDVFEDVVERDDFKIIGWENETQICDYRQVRFAHVLKQLDEMCKDNLGLMEGLRSELYSIYQSLFEE